MSADPVLVWILAAELVLGLVGLGGLLWQWRQARLEARAFWASPIAQELLRIARGDGLEP